MDKFLVARGNSGFRRHAVVNGRGLCGYKPEGSTAMGRGRARWEYCGDALQGVAGVSCPKCKKKLAAASASGERLP